MRVVCFTKNDFKQPFIEFRKLDKIYIDEEKISLFMPLDPPNKENALEVFKYYIGNNNVDFNRIIDTFEKQCQIQQARYSNGQIKNIVELTKMNNAICSHISC